MAGGKRTPRKDIGIKVSSGQPVKTGQILIKGIHTYKSGENVRGLGTLYAFCAGKIYFSKRKTPHGKVRTFINILADKKSAK